MDSKQFTFAGFTFPRYVGTLPRGPFSKRIERMRNPITGGYITSPAPRVAGAGEVFFCLDSDFMPGLRWQWCDDVATRIQHTGWFCDSDGQGDKIRGLVMRLPNGRGFLAGWSMGEGMASAVDLATCPDAISAALVADDMAQQTAEREQEYREEQEPDNY